MTISYLTITRFSRLALSESFRVGGPTGCNLRTDISDGAAKNWSFRFGLIGEPSTAVEVLALARNLSKSDENAEQEGLERRMESLGRFARSIVHDFNNFLTVSSIHSQLLLKRIGEFDPLRKDVEKIKKAGDEASRLTGLLALVTTSGWQPPRDVDLNSLIASREGTLQDLLGSDIQLATELAPQVGQVSIDPGDFEQVLMNLTLNAREAMLQGGRLVVETRIAGETKAIAAADTETRQVQLSFSDGPD